MHVIREMDRGDAAAVLRLAAAFSQENGVAAPDISPTDFWRQSDRDPPLFVVFVAEPQQGGAPVGYILVTFAFELRSAAMGGRMEDLYVTPRARRSGVGRGLMAAATRLIAQRGGRWLEWRAAAKDGDALMFYRRVGARAAAGRVLYLGPAETHGLVRSVDKSRIALA